MKHPLKHLGTHHDIISNSVYLVVFEKLQQAAFPPPQKIGNLFSKSFFFFAAVEKGGCLIKAAKGHFVVELIILGDFQGTVTPQLDSFVTGFLNAGLGEIHIFRLFLAL